MLAQVRIILLSLPLEFVRHLSLADSREGVRAGLVSCLSQRSHNVGLMLIAAAPSVRYFHDPAADKPRHVAFGVAELGEDLARVLAEHRRREADGRGRAVHA